MRKSYNRFKLISPLSILRACQNLCNYLIPVSHNFLFRLFFRTFNTVPHFNHLTRINFCANWLERSHSKIPKYIISCVSWPIISSVLPWLGWGYKTLQNYPQSFLIPWFPKLRTQFCLGISLFFIFQVSRNDLQLNCYYVKLKSNSPFSSSHSILHLICSKIRTRHYSLSHQILNIIILKIGMLV